VVAGAATTSLEPGRRPIARGKDEATEADIYRSSPQLASLLRSEFTALVAGFRQEGGCHHYLPPVPARIHGFVYLCQPEETREFSRSLAFLTVLLNARLEVPAEELVAAALRVMARCHDDPHAFLVAAGKELAGLLSGDFNRLKAILGRLS